MKKKIMKTSDQGDNDDRRIFNISLENSDLGHRRFSVKFSPGMMSVKSYLCDIYVIYK